MWHVLVDGGGAQWACGLTHLLVRWGIPTNELRTHRWTTDCAQLYSAQSSSRMLWAITSAMAACPAGEGWT